MGGFGFGVLSAIVFLPYITFGKWDAARKRTLLVICLPAIVAGFVIFLSIFYTNKLRKCAWCEVFDCVDFVDNFCADNSQSVL